MKPHLEARSAVVIRRMWKRPGKSMRKLMRRRMVPTKTFVGPQILQNVLLDVIYAGKLLKRPYLRH